MIKILGSGTPLNEVLYRGESGSTDSVEPVVAQIIETVKQNGDSALLDYTQRFDGVALSSLEVGKAEIDSACDTVGEEFTRILRASAANIEAFHRRQVRTNYIINDTPGVVLGQLVTPIEKVGIYVPGGTASYPSSVLMNAIPAKIAGVSEIVMVTPPGRDGRVPNEILAAARIAGVTRVFRVGGAQAVAALAYGTESIPKVDKIVGPGNIYVACAKRRVFGLVAIDMIAGPSEILIVSDGNSNPAFLAADMLSQAEHDKNASAVLICTDSELAQRVSEELERQIPLLPRAEIARASIDANGKIIVADSLAQAVDISNAIAPEHLELCVDAPFELLGRVKNAGSIFLGRSTPEALGDYFAGSNHVLPTLGTARFSSALSVDDFVKKSSFISYSEDALGRVAGMVSGFARAEGLEAHARSVDIRGKSNE